MSEAEIVQLAMDAVREVIDREVPGAAGVSVPAYADGYLLEGVSEFVACVMDSLVEGAFEEAA